MHLRWLDLARNQLSAPPEGLADMTNLEVLNWASNDINERDWAVFVANIVNVEHNPVCRSPDWSVTVTSQDGHGDPTVVGLSRELPTTTRLPADRIGVATDDAGALSHRVVDAGHQEDGTAADGGLEEGNPSFDDSSTIVELVFVSASEDGGQEGDSGVADNDEQGSGDADNNDQGSGDSDNDDQGSGDADNEDHSSGDADDNEQGSGDADDQMQGSGEVDVQKQGSGDADEKEGSGGLYEDDMVVSDMDDTEEGAAMAHDPMQGDLGENGVEAGGGTIAGSANGVAEDYGKGGGGGTIAGSANGVSEDDGEAGADQDDREGVDMDVGVDANMAAG